MDSAIPVCDRPSTFVFREWPHCTLLTTRAPIFHVAAIKDFIIDCHKTYFAKEANELFIFHAK